METAQLITSIVSTLIGLIGGGIGILYWRENKALKQKEVDKASIENELQQAKAWKDLFTQEHEKCERKSQEKQALYKERDDLKEKLNKAYFRIEQLCWYHCTRNGCQKRIPPHRFDEQGNEIAAEMGDLKDI